MDVVKCTVEETGEPVEVPMVRENVAVWVSSKPGSPRERYRAALVVPVCDHKHRSLRAAVLCSFERVEGFAEHLKEVAARAR